MPPDTASTANNDDNVTPVATPPAQPDYSSPNDLTYEMTAEEEAAFVDATLGIKGAKNVTEPVTPAADQPAQPAVPEGQSKQPETPAPDPAVPETPVVPEAPVTSEPAEPKAPQPATELTAPETSDLWIEVQDSEGKDVKLTYDPNNPNSFLPEGFTFKDDNQLFQILDAKAEMASLYKERVSEYETKTAELEAKQGSIKTEADQKASWDAEIQDLIEGGLLDAPKITDPSDKKFMEDPTVAKVDAVFKFMAEQNRVRPEGKPLLRSFGTAFNLYNKVSADAEAEAKTKQANDMAKARGALVGGTSAPSSASETPLYRRGSAKNIWEATRDLI
jgi:hypothetical protein